MKLNKITLRRKESGPSVKLQHRRFIEAHAQDSCQLKISTKLVPDKAQWNSGRAGLELLVGM